MREELGLNSHEVYPWNKLSVKFVEKGAKMLERLALESNIPLNQCWDRWGAKSILRNQWCNSAAPSRTVLRRTPRLSKSISSRQDVPEEQGADEHLSALNTDEELDPLVPSPVESGSENDSSQLERTRSPVPRRLPIHPPTKKVGKRPDTAVQGTRKRRHADVSHTDAGTVENDLETAENDLLTFDLPLNYLPGMDLPSKRVLKTQTTIDITTWSLLDISNGTYCSAGTEWKNGMRCDVLYTPRLSIQALLLPILNHQFLIHTSCRVGRSHPSLFVTREIVGLSFA
ncbi:hypothetical protein DFQ28_008950 [Apophysomyces sp. BC1034]|nr:hypothetical protein DFQ29_007950 [Apophysomyces sp. BC1021]KAG0185699.1 hypothetical protein DFQ28_008950 [Apophysomyces sp. BC1034]